MKFAPRTLPAVAVAGLLAAGLVAAGAPTATAQPADGPRSSADRGSATRPTCTALLAGILPSGRMVIRDVTNVRITREKKTVDPLPYRVDYIETGYPTEKVEGGYRHNFQLFANGKRTRGVDVLNPDEGTTLEVGASTTYRTGLPARLIAGSGRFYRYGVDAGNNLKRWDWSIDDQDQLLFSDPKLILKNQGSLKTLIYWGTTRRPDGVRYDVLFGTTHGGAFKQFQIPWSNAGKLRQVTLRSTGFASFTSVSTTYCRGAGFMAGLIYIDRRSNQARWYTVAHPFNPKPRDVARRAAVAPGAEWRLHATF